MVVGQIYSLVKQNFLQAVTAVIPACHQVDLEPSVSIEAMLIYPCSGKDYRKE